VYSSSIVVCVVVVELLYCNDNPNIYLYYSLLIIFEYMI